MCEIAILDPERYNTGQLKEACTDLYQSMRHSLGVVAVHENLDDMKFGYEVFKQVDPDKTELLNFIENNEGCHRLIIHGRLATHGEVTRKNAHPLEIKCRECNVDYVVHNGVVYQHERKKRIHQSQGHSYQTDVDSEAIAHDYGDVPAGFGESGEPKDLHSREPGFILLNEDRMFIHARAYHLTKDARMVKNRRDFGPEYDEQSYMQIAYPPGGIE